MALKSLVVFVDPTPEGEARARYAIKLAVQHDAHLIGVFISATAWSRNSADGFVRGRPRFGKWSSGTMSRRRTLRLPH